MRGRRRPVLRGVARTAVVAGTASAVSGRVHRRQQNRWAQEDQAAYEQEMTAPPPAPPPPAASDGVAELTQLAQLHDQGILTDEEFAAKKAQILGI